MNRFTAFLTHFGISLLIFLALGYVILYHWYPDFFFFTDGGWQGMRIVAAVDLVLGPLLTLCVFKPGKPGLKTDLTLIGVFQAACLLAGVYVVYSERPLAMVYSDGFFHSLTADEYRDAGQHLPELTHLPGSAPKWVTIVLPDDPARQAEIRKSAWENEIPLRAMTEFYRPFAGTDVDPDRDPIRLQDIERDRGTELAEFMTKQGGKPQDYLFLPFGARYSYALIVLRRSDRSVVGTMLLPPVAD